MPCCCPVKVSIALGGQCSDEVHRYGANTMMPDEGRRGECAHDGSRCARLRTSSGLKTNVLLLSSKAFCIINSLQLREEKNPYRPNFAMVCVMRLVAPCITYMLLSGEGEHHPR